MNGSLKIILVYTTKDGKRQVESRRTLNAHQVRSITHRGIVMHETSKALVELEHHTDGFSE
jgi:hypothetical protein